MAALKRRTPREDAILAFAGKYLPASVHAPVGSPGWAMAMKEGRGARIKDFSENEYIDYLLGAGTLLLGHAHPVVVSAVRAQLEQGSSYHLINEPAVLLAELIVKTVPCAEKVAFNSTGSQSAFVAMRLARAHRGRDKILKFEGAFHGTSDYALMSNQWTCALGNYPMAVPNSSGIPAAVEAEVLVAPFNDIETTTAIIEKHHDEIAGVIVEPLQRTIPPKPGFLQALREACDQYGAVLIFDETTTGFRLAPGGAQEYYGVVPDLCAIGESISGGHPFAAVCGKDEIMSLTDPAHYGTGHYVVQTGTFGGNPISCAAALATLEQLTSGDVHEKLFATGTKLRDALQASLDDAGLPAQVSGEPPVFEVWFSEEEICDFRTTLIADDALHARFGELLRERGVIKAHKAFYISTAHDGEDIERTIEAFAMVAAELRG